MGAVKSLPDRLREASGYALMDAARVTVLEAAAEIERLRNGAPSGCETVRLTDLEREAIDAALGWCDDRDTETITTLRGLLERLQ